jgi:hypothetical protein
MSRLLVRCGGGGAVMDPGGAQVVKRELRLQREKDAKRGGSKVESAVSGGGMTTLWLCDDPVFRFRFSPFLLPLMILFVSIARNAEWPKAKSLSLRPTFEFIPPRSWAQKAGLARHGIHCWSRVFLSVCPLFPLLSKAGTADDVDHFFSPIQQFSYPIVYIGESQYTYFEYHTLLFLTLYSYSPLFITYHYIYQTDYDHLNT